jgi:hypothetical protein
MTIGYCKRDKDTDRLIRSLRKDESTLAGDKDLA